MDEHLCNGSLEMLQCPYKTLHILSYESHNSYAKSHPAIIYMHAVKPRPNSVMH